MANPCSARFAFLLPIALASSIGLPAATISLTSVGVAYTQNFDSLASSGTDHTLSLTGWLLHETGTNANQLYVAGTGSSTTGDTYSFGSANSTDRALGTLRTGTLVPTFGAAFTNNTGVTITSLLISYTGEQWRLGNTGRTDRLDFQYSLDATSLSTGTWIDFDALDFTSPNTTTFGALDGNAAGNHSSIAATLTGLSLAPGATFFIRWSDFDAAGSDDGLAIDDFSLTPIPEPAAAASLLGLAALAAVVATRRRGGAA